MYHHQFVCNSFSFDSNCNYNFLLFRTHVSMPLAIFYRFHSTVCLCEIWKRAYKMKPTYMWSSTLCCYVLPFAHQQRRELYNFIWIFSSIRHKIVMCSMFSAFFLSMFKLLPNFFLFTYFIWLSYERKLLLSVTKKKQTAQAIIWFAFHTLFFSQMTHLFIFFKRIVNNQSSYLPLYSN